MIIEADLFAALPELGAESVDCLVTDPPYGIGYGARKWDTFAPAAGQSRIVPRSAESQNPNVRGRRRSPASSPSAVEYDRSLAGQRAFQAFTQSWAEQVYRVLKPGAYAVVCGAPRSYHRMACGLEDAGFELRDSFADLVDRSDVFDDLVDSLSLIQREMLLRCLGMYDSHMAWVFGQGFPKSVNLGDGRGSGLKPAFEPIVLARKPLRASLRSTVAATGVGALNIDACRVGGERWPSNATIDETAEMRLGAEAAYFYCSKPSRAERDRGLRHLAAVPGGLATGRKDGAAGLKSPRSGAGRGGRARNIHPTVKPIDLMRWLVRLVCPPSGVVLDPFAGSFTTAVACVHEGRDYIAIEREPEYVLIGRRRINAIAPLLHDAFAE